MTGGVDETLAPKLANLLKRYTSNHSYANLYTVVKIFPIMLLESLRCPTDLQFLQVHSQRRLLPHPCY